MNAIEVILLVVVCVLVVALIWPRLRRPRRSVAPPGARRILVPFVGNLDPTVGVNPSVTRYRQASSSSGSTSAPPAPAKK